jgi:hypothetical protein
MRNKKGLYSEMIEREKEMEEIVLSKADNLSVIEKMVLQKASVIRKAGIFPEN